MRFNNTGGDGGQAAPSASEGLVFPPGTARFLKIGAGVLAVVLVFIILSIARGVYTDWLWFDNLGFLNVYTTILTTRIWLFFAGALVLAGLVGTSFYFAHRFSQGPQYLSIPQQSLMLLRRLIVVAMVLLGFIISIIFGLVASGRWETILLYRNAVPFTQAGGTPLTDPVFHKSVGFYVFSLPVFHLIQGWLLGAVIVITITSLGIYAAYYSLRGVSFSITPRMHAHLAVLAAAFLFIIALGHFLDIYELVFSGQGAVFGATYADLNARLPSLRLLTGVAAVGGVLMLVSIFLRTLQQRIRLAVGAFGLWVIAAIVVGAIFPALLQRFIVNPNEIARESIYIDRNIEWSRNGFALDSIVLEDYPAREDVTAETILNNPETIDNLRLWDHRPLRDVYNQIQHLRLYYNFLDVDVDRYTINGDYRQVMLSARELAPENFDPSAQRWINRKLQYTHGYGVAMSPVTEFTGEGKPEFFLQDIPPQGDLKLDRPEIYYGEGQTDFVVVKTNEPEFDRPPNEKLGETLPAYATYEGVGGVNLSSPLRRIAYAWQMTDFNVLISSRITKVSRVQYRRTLQERVGVVAPFLRLDQDPYVVVDDDRLFWIQDAYTVTDRFPYSTRFADDFNYIRNSVKVVMDAYNGTLHFYVADPNDPLVRTYENIFPVLFEPLEDIEKLSPGLLSHVRYPEDLFSIQAEMYLRYHMTNAKQFFGKEDLWSVPTETVRRSPTQVLPYYVIMKLPGETREEFVLILPFTPANKPNLVGWLAARSDAPHYGELVAFTFPKGRQVFGTSQIEARIDNNTEISEQFTLWDQSGSEVIRGNLLVVPIGEDTILYVEPVYLQSVNLLLPELKRVIVASGNTVVWAPTLDESLALLLKEVTPVEELRALLGKGITPAEDVTPTAPAAPGDGPPSLELLELQKQLGAFRDALKELGKGFSQIEEMLQELEK